MLEDFCQLSLRDFGDRCFLLSFSICFWRVSETQNNGCLMTEEHLYFWKGETFKDDELAKQSELMIGSLTHAKLAPMDDGHLHLGCTFNVHAQLMWKVVPEELCFGWKFRTSLYILTRCPVGQEMITCDRRDALLCLSATVNGWQNSSWQPCLVCSLIKDGSISFLFLSVFIMLVPCAAAEKMTCPI